MISKLQRYFEQHMRTTGPAQVSDHALRLATAALLVEMARADFKHAPGERESVADNLQRYFDLTPAETESLLALAETEAHESASLYQFTELVNKHYSPVEKVRVIEMLWRVAYADGYKDKYEEHLVRKIAELLYVPHTAFIQARIKVEAELG